MATTDEHLDGYIYFDHDATASFAWKSLAWAVQRSSEPSLGPLSVWPTLLDLVHMDGKRTNLALHRPLFVWPLSKQTPSRTLGFLALEVMGRWLVLAAP